ncbi:MAG: hypothetical protein JO235_28730 [Chroococcidiopsidaceae cyanobacterium CP_BM_RX_35]|nr:hypothetical protein [Chroococcidiopsidaceae cyanobacterium CP_BM_RX_35]
MGFLPRDKTFLRSTYLEHVGYNECKHSPTVGSPTDRCQQAVSLPLRPKVLRTISHEDYVQPVGN